MHGTQPLRGADPTSTNRPPYHKLSAMKALTLSATFDGEHIRLEEPHLLPKNARLLVTVLPTEDAAATDRDHWLALAAQGLSRAYGPDEPEYPDTVIKEPNPLYNDGR
jgi:hypothetical protein